MQIETLDLRFQGIPQCVASYLLERKILLECGPTTTLPALLHELSQRQLAPSDIRAVIVTHIHLDHAGSAGWWANQGVPVYVHEMGAPHLIDPSKLLASAGRIYGDQMDPLWGEVLACPGDKVVPLAGDGPLTIDGVTLRTLETPGHATHHFAFACEDGIFCGDVAGVRLPGSEFLSVPAPPPEFHLEKWQASIRKLEAEAAPALYLTHFGEVRDSAAHFARLRDKVQSVCDFVGQREQLEREALVEEYYAWQRQEMDEASFIAYEKANPLFMSVDGLRRYWKKKAAP